MNRERGFTLIEIMLVVAILGIVAAIAIPNILGYKDDIVEKYRVIDTISIGFGEIKKVCWDGKVYLIDPEGEITQVFKDGYNMNNNMAIPETCDNDEIIEDEVVKKESGHISYD